MRWVIRLSNRAERARRRIPARERRRVDASLLEMEEDPLSGDITMLRGSYEGSYRRRVGNWRVIFTLRSCPKGWCKSGSGFALSGGFGRFGQAAAAGSLTKGSSLNGAMVSSVM